MGWGDSGTGHLVRASHARSAGPEGVPSLASAAAGATLLCPGACLASSLPWCASPTTCLSWCREYSLLVLACELVTCSLSLDVCFLVPISLPLTCRVLLHAASLGASCLLYASTRPLFFASSLYGGQGKDMADTLLLLNQLISKFGPAVSPLFEDLLPGLVARMAHLLPTDLGSLMAAPVGNAGSTAEVRGSHSVYVAVLCSCVCTVRYCMSVL